VGRTSRSFVSTVIMLVALIVSLALWPAPAGAQWYPYPSYRYAAPESNVRVIAKPKEATVYVDGYYAGLVDDFDGYLQRLRVTPGEHEITLFLQGYRTVSQKLYLQVNSTLKLELAMEKLAPGETSEPVSPPVERPPEAQGPPPGYGQPRAPLPPGAPFPGAPPQQPERPAPPSQAPGEPSTLGTLAVRIQPPGTTVTIDGEPRPGSQWDEVLLVQLPEGPHRVQIEKKGYEPFSGEFDLRPGQTTNVTVSLQRRR
jgi:hypothetical protein